MKIHFKDLSIIFDKIKKKQMFMQTSVAIFVAYDADSICAIQILRKLLKSEDILFEIFIINGYHELEDHQNQIENHENIQFVIMVNCGALIDLSEKFNERLTCYVFDNHRPIHHENVYSPKRVVIIDDDYANLDQCPSKEQFDEYEAKQDSNENDEDDNNFFEFTSDEEDDENEEEDDNEEKLLGEDQEFNDDEQIEIGKKRKLQKRQQRIQQKKMKLEQSELVKKYYDGTFYGRSTAGLLYELAKQKNMETNEFLWFAIIGLTDMYLSNKISQNDYSMIAKDLELEVQRKNNRPEENEQKQNGLLENENDLKIPLLRHWSIWESMYYSTYLAPRLGIWKENEAGKIQLRKLIQECGISLENSEQKYNSLNSSKKNQFKEQLCKAASSGFELSDILFNSFVKQIDSKLCMSASDMVYCVNCILTNLKDSKDEYNCGEKKKRKEILNSKFWLAADLIVKQNVNQINEIVQKAIEFQKALIKEAIHLFEKRSITPCSKFRYGILKNDTNEEKSYFNHPFSLKKLALFIMEIYKVQKQEMNPKPVVLCVQDENSKTYQIIGVVGANSYQNNGNRNNFGSNFRIVAHQNHLNMDQDDFESSFITLNKEDLFTFIENLTELK